MQQQKAGNVHQAATAIRVLVPSKGGVIAFKKTATSPAQASISAGCTCSFGF
jgi:hypothetical protein